MKLPEYKVDFLLKYSHRLLDRSFIIDILTAVGDRTPFVCYGSEMITPSKLTTTISFNELPEDAKYYRPYNIAEIKKEYGEDAKILEDPIHKWRAENSIDVIHKEPDMYEYIRTYRNWKCMTDEQKVKSDQKCKEWFNKTNEELFPIIFDQYTNVKLGDIIELCNYANDNSCLAAIVELTTDHITFQYMGPSDEKLYSEIDTFNLSPDMKYDNCKVKETITTTVGRYLLNYILLYEPFKDKFDYVNAQMKVKQFNKDVSRLVLNDEINIDDYKKYINNAFFIGHFTELCVPTFSRKSLITDPKMMQYKQELLKKYEGKLDDPVVMTQLEDELMAIDAQFLKGDTCERFYGAVNQEKVSIARKKMFVTVGGIESFSKKHGEYVFMKNSLSEGWDPSNLPNIANEIRKGSYNRGHETALSGVQTKYIVRVFQDLQINSPDCGTSRGLEVDFSKLNINDFIGRYVKVGSTWIAITEQNKSNFNGKKYIIRSPMYCQNKEGICYMCAGEIISKLDVKHMSMLAVDITSTFLMVSMKLMHGSKLSLIDIDDLNKYVFD